VECALLPGDAQPFLAISRKAPALVQKSREQRPIAASVAGFKQD
jgi:hypothetical protein